MCHSARLYNCVKCHAQVIICRHCDRGHRYCLNGCADIAKKESSQRASKKYQATRQGKLNNAARQQRFRDKQKQKVTHQGSLAKPRRVVLTNTIKRPEKPPQTPKSNTLLTCHQCNCPCDPFLRQGFLNNHRSQVKSTINRLHH